MSERSVAPASPPARPPPTAGFQLASGRPPALSPRRANAQPRATAAPPSGPIDTVAAAGFRTASNKAVAPVSETNRVKYDKLLEIEQQARVSSISDQTSDATGFRTASNKAMTPVSETNRAKYDKLLEIEQQARVSSMSDQTSDATGFRTASNKAMTPVSETNRAKYDKLLEIEQQARSTLADHEPPSDTGFRTASNKAMTPVSEASRAKYQKLLEIEEQARTSSTSDATGFRTASNKAMTPVSEASRAKYDKLLEIEQQARASSTSGPATAARPSATPTNGFRTANNKAVAPVSDADRAKYQKLLELEQLAKAGMLDNADDDVPTTTAGADGSGENDVDSRAARARPAQLLHSKPALHSRSGGARPALHGNLHTPRHAGARLMAGKRPASAMAGSAHGTATREREWKAPRITSTPAPNTTRPPSQTEQPKVRTGLARSSASQQSGSALLRKRQPAFSVPRRKGVGGLGTSQTPYRPPRQRRPTTTPSASSEPHSTNPHAQSMTNRQLALTNALETAGKRDAPRKTLCDLAAYAARPRVSLRVLTAKYGRMAAPAPRDVSPVSWRSAPFFLFARHRRGAAFDGVSVECDLLDAGDVREQLLQSGVQRTLMRNNWFEHHFALIVWKLAALERAFPVPLGSRYLTATRVLEQLRYRYERELNRAQRSVLHKLIEGDVAPQVHMVLVVADVLRQQPGDGVLVLSDGWHVIRAKLDTALAALLVRGRIAIGDKLRMCGATLNDAEAVAPLEPAASPDGGESAPTLRLEVNHTRRAVFDAPLGAARAPSFRVALRSLCVGGGSVPYVDVCVQRIYPLRFCENGGPHGRTMWRTEADERAAQLAHDRERETRYHRRLAEWERSREKRSQSGGASGRTAAKRQRSELNELDGGELYDEMMRVGGGQPSADFAARLAPGARQRLEREVDARRMTEHASFDASLADDPSMRERRASPRFRVLVSERGDGPRGQRCLLGLWHKVQLHGALREGAYYRCYGMRASSRASGGVLELTSARHSRIEPRKAPSDAADFVPRECVSIGALLSQVAGGTCDAVCVVASTRSNLTDRSAVLVCGAAPSGGGDAPVALLRLQAVHKRSLQQLRVGSLVCVLDARRAHDRMHGVTLVPQLVAELDSHVVVLERKDARALVHSTKVPAMMRDASRELGVWAWAEPAEPSYSAALELADALAGSPAPRSAMPDQQFAAQQLRYRASAAMTSANASTRAAVDSAAASSTASTSPQRHDSPPPPPPPGQQRAWRNESNAQRRSMGSASATSMYSHEAPGSFNSAATTKRMASTQERVSRSELHQGHFQLPLKALSLAADATDTCGAPLHASLMLLATRSGTSNTRMLDGQRCFFHLCQPQCEVDDAHVPQVQFVLTFNDGKREWPTLLREATLRAALTIALRAQHTSGAQQARLGAARSALIAALELPTVADTANDDSNESASSQSGSQPMAVDVQRRGVRSLRGVRQKQLQHAPLTERAENDVNLVERALELVRRAVVVPKSVLRDAFGSDDDDDDGGGQHTPSSAADDEAVLDARLADCDACGLCSALGLERRVLLADAEWQALLRAVVCVVASRPAELAFGEPQQLLLASGSLFTVWPVTRFK